MTYALAVESLFARGHELIAKPANPRRKFDLEQMRVLAAELGHPEHAFRSVLIAGTNGKGSTAAMLANILQAAGYHAGLYTSPHLSRVNERIRSNGVLISDEDFARLYFQVDEAASRLLRAGKLPQPPSFFETMTAVGFLYFAERGVDLAVLEVGMGGRLDATNIVEPLLSIVTDISLDHMEWLGSTIADIAHEKAGILRPGGTLITLPQHPEANRALGESAIALGVTGISAVEFMPQVHSAIIDCRGNTEYTVTLLGQTVQLAPALAGTHQHRNTALSVTAAVALRNSHGYIITPQNIADGIRDTRWPGRLEWFPSSEQRCAVLLDVAHNPAGAWTLRSALGSYPGIRRKTLLFGCLRDKAISEMAQILFPVFDHVILSPVDSPRSASVEELLLVAETLGVSAQSATTPLNGLLQAQQQTASHDLVVCAGSIYLVGPVRDALAAPAGSGL